ncbi:single-stranded-DNA-specific exonuclease RecJ, partial [Leptolyngbya sp. FACHB-36]|uniref:DHHA1 domain-containing protein n=1 Tax=Leptolyngbya sp. FACHB-36 TaxID=2692808 RepID=UPI0019875FDF
GDRPTDISFGIGPRLNAVSRIQGDAHFCVELLTSRDTHLCTHLADATELANARRKALQADVLRQVQAKLAQLDLSTAHAIVLADEQWQPGVLGLVAGQIAQEHGRPTILLSIEGPIARGSARSTNQIDLYQLVKDQEHLLHRFGGHPYAAGLSLPVENLPLFRDAVNQGMAQRSSTIPAPLLPVDLAVTVSELGKPLFQALKLLEPCGMGNPVPRLLIQDCWFQQVWNKKIQDWKGRQVQYIKTEFELWDESASEGFAGVWWGHYKEDLPQGRCDVVVELDSNSFKRRYEVRLIAVRPSATVQERDQTETILDWRGQAEPHGEFAEVLQVQRCPGSWAELQVWVRRSRLERRPLAISYSAPPLTNVQETWQTLVGIAKYLSRTGYTATRQQLLNKLGIGDRALQLGIQSLNSLGFSLDYAENAFHVTWQERQPDAEFGQFVDRFFNAVREEQFRRQYFYQVPLATIQAITQRTPIDA